MEHGLNEEDRLLAMRARPKILVAGNYEEALEIYKRIRYKKGIANALGNMAVIYSESAR